MKPGQSGKNPWGINRFVKFKDEKAFAQSKTPHR
jgi:hypothetical protein